MLSAYLQKIEKDCKLQTRQNCCSAPQPFHHAHCAAAEGRQDGSFSGFKGPQPYRDGGIRSLASRRSNCHVPTAIGALLGPAMYWRQHPYVLGTDPLGGGRGCWVRHCNSLLGLKLCNLFFLHLNGQYQIDNIISHQQGWLE